MKCPFCQHEETQVVDSRLSDEGDSVRRRRRCAACDRRFTTYERADLGMPSVVKKNGSRVEFSPAKLRASMMLALRKRPVSAPKVDQAIHHITEKLLTIGLREIPTSQLGEMVMLELRQLDQIAYIRFASRLSQFRRCVRIPRRD